METKLFDKIADDELKALDKALEDFDPDEVEVDTSPGVLSLTLASGDKVIINSHRAAGEIWMAAFRNAWHFAPHAEADGWIWRTAKDELRSTLSGLLTQKLGRTISL